jgi:hypothetical protein
MSKYQPSSRSPRDFTVEERRQKFLDFKAKMTATSEAEEVATIWHAVDDPMTPEQYEEIPPGNPGVSGRTMPIWVKYRHRRRREVVVAKGCFDHEDGCWMARYDPVDDGDYICRVEPIAWAKIVPSVTPEGVVIASPAGAGI